VRERERRGEKERERDTGREGGERVREAKKEKDVLIKK
jgi:hypothetical protein